MNIIKSHVWLVLVATIIFSSCNESKNSPQKEDEGGINMQRILNIVKDLTEKTCFLHQTNQDFVVKVKKSNWKDFFSSSCDLKSDVDIDASSLCAGLYERVYTINRFAEEFFYVTVTLELSQAQLKKGLRMADGEIELFISKDGLEILNMFSLIGSLLSCNNPKYDKKILHLNAMVSFSLYDHMEKLFSEGVDVNGNVEYSTLPIILAVRNRDAKMVKYLLSRGADPNKKDLCGRTARTVAKDLGYTEIGEILNK